MIIGLTGTLGAGKSIVADYLQKKGWIYLSLSNEVREEAKKRSITVTRENLQLLGNEVRQNEGNAVWAEKSLIRITDPQKNYIIDGIRNPAEIQLFKQLGNFYVVAVDAPRQLRFQRLLARNRESDPRTLLDFMKIDSKDLGQGEEDCGQQVMACMKMADAIILNESSVERMRDKTSFAVQQLVNKDAMGSVGSAF
jgi:dephospho-CoA kinase